MLSFVLVYYVPCAVYSVLNNSVVCECKRVMKVCSGEEQWSKKLVKG